jgi:hypothetical protein
MGIEEDVDAYGHPWRVADLRFECDPEEMRYWTERINEDFYHNNRFQHPPPEDDPDAPDLFPDFTGVANFVRFGSSTERAFYCFDFGTN